LEHNYKHGHCAPEAGTGAVVWGAITNLKEWMFITVKALGFRTLAAGDAAGAGYIQHAVADARVAMSRKLVMFDLLQYETYQPVEDYAEVAGYLASFLVPDMKNEPLTVSTPLLCTSLCNAGNPRYGY
jgi:hypothetical protein